MALVFGQSFFSAAPLAELGGSYTDFKGGATGEDSDDEEYVYVSRLAEQIAAHAMLDEEEDDPTLRRQQATMHCNEANAKEGKLQKAGRVQVQAGDYSVSHFAAAWRDYGPTEWDCFYTPTLQPHSATQAYAPSLDQMHKFRRWRSLGYEGSKQAGPHAKETWNTLSHSKTQPFSCESPALQRKESIGTGVFLPKIVNTGPSHYRRKAGLSSRSAYAPRSKC